MATAAAPSNTTSDKAYSYSRGAASATRALIDSSNPSPGTTSGIATPSDPASPQATLHRRKTNNYESALTDRLNASLVESGSTPMAKDDISSSTTHTQAPSGSGTGPTISSGLAYRGDEAAAKTIPAGQQAYTSQNDANSGTSRPGLAGAGMLGRQQSWKQTDQKRAVMDRMLNSDAAGQTHKVGGYTSSAPGTSA